MKQGTNNEVSFVEIKLNSWQFIIVTMRSWLKFYRVQVTEAVTFAAAVAKEVILSLLDIAIIRTEESCLAIPCCYTRPLCRYLWGCPAWQLVDCV